MTISMPLWFVMFCFGLGLGELIGWVTIGIARICLWIDRWSHSRAWEKCYRTAFEYECARAGTKTLFD